MGVVLDQPNVYNSKQIASELSQNVFNPDHQNMPILSFECIKDPGKVCRIAQDARDSIIRNNLTNN